MAVIIGTIFNNNRNTAVYSTICINNSTGIVMAVRLIFLNVEKGMDKKQQEKKERHGKKQ